MTWKNVHFLPNWDVLHLFPIPELSSHLCHPGLVFSPLFISQILTLSSALWIKNSDALSVSFWSDESRLISLRIPTVMRSLLDPAAETASSQIGNHRHQHSLHQQPLFSVRQKSDGWRIADFENWTTGNQDSEAARSNRRLQNKQPGLLVECRNTLLPLNILLNYSTAN